MPKRDISDSESEDANENSSSEEAEAATHVHPQGVSEYEKQRLSRIAENRARLEALGLPKMASWLKRPGHNVTVKKGKRKVGDDEEYVPDDAEARLSSSSEDEEGFVREIASLSRKRKLQVKKRSSKPKARVSRKRSSKPKARVSRKRSSKPKARVSRKDPSDNPHHIDDDEALKQAISLSLQDSAEGSCFSDKHVANTAHAAIKGRHHIQEDKGRKKNKKSDCIDCK